jgi:hypothetical protein
MQMSQISKEAAVDFKTSIILVEKTQTHVNSSQLFNGYLDLAKCYIATSSFHFATSRLTRKIPKYRTSKLIP